MTTLLLGGHVFDSAMGQRRQSDVLIDGDRITRVGDCQRERQRSYGHRHEGMTILPGLINMHEHLTMRRTWGPPHKQFVLAEPYLVIRGVRGALASLRQGITTVRELGARSHMNVFLKTAIDFDMVPGPLTFSSCGRAHLGYRRPRLDLVHGGRRQ